MRISELNLIAYGKFTDHRLVFPNADHDFHVIIGPNEAGKSTIRRAITELLFGMERQSPLGFKHPQSDLKLGAILEAPGLSLPFIRSKQQKSLRSLHDEALPDAYLSPVLGSLTQEAFESLHCLDHDRLVKGGQGIVDPKNSVSQILFQAASGLEGFAEIRDALLLRSTELFSTRGHKNEYSQAASRYQTAQKTLKEVQVRTKEWVQARDAYTGASEALAAEKSHRRSLELNRTVWERARRLASRIARLNALKEDIEALGETIVFPPSAKDTLDNGIVEMDKAAGMVTARQRDVQERQQALETIIVDESVLASAADVLRLADCCGLYANHHRDLPLRREEVVFWLKKALGMSEEFGWGATEEELRNRLPAEKVLRSIDTLLKERGAILAEAGAAAEAMAERKATLDDLKQKVEGLAEASLDPRLVLALSSALPYKGSDAKKKALQGALTLAEAAASRAMAALGRPDLNEATLRALSLPSVSHISALQATRQKLVQAVDVARSMAYQTEESVEAMKLQLLQFQRAHKVVTVADVSTARQERDEQWEAIKSGGIALPVGAPQLDLALRLADELADARTVSESDAASMQSLRDQLEAAEHALVRQEKTVEAKQRELDEFDSKWLEETSKMGLAGTALDDMLDWLAKRDAALQSFETVLERRHELAQERERAEEVAQTLSAALLSAGLQFDAADGLGVLCAKAEEHNKLVERTRAVRDSLTERLQEAKAALSLAGQVQESKEAAMQDWRDGWEKALSNASLSSLIDNVGAVEAAVDAARQIRQLLEKVDTHRLERIEAMERDLETLGHLAEQLAQVLAPEMVERPAAELSRMLAARLEEAKRQAQRRDEAQKFLDGAKRQLAEASSAYEQAKQTLEPLLKQAGVEDPLAAVSLVEKSLAKVQLEQELSDTRRELEKESDGLTLEQAEAEVASHPVADAPAKLLELEDQLRDSEKKLTELAQAELTAKQAFDQIDGSDKAAIAEAQKQEALADMAEASEEYLQIATASSLLKWAVDRYRDRKQGPLLLRASTVFQNLTLGSFEKLRIDYDQSPPALVAYRPNNQPVKVSGLSDGTRDQLFLALRIAALELQTEQGSPVPFVADDLFINFDDQRSQAGLKALFELSKKTQVLFISHQEHLLPVIKQLFAQANVITLAQEEAFNT